MVSSRIKFGNDPVEILDRFEGDGYGARAFPVDFESDLRLEPGVQSRPGLFEPGRQQVQLRGFSGSFRGAAGPDKVFDLPDG
jgi:hypothetical protein